MADQQEFKPFNLSVMDVNKFITQFRLSPVTSLAIIDASTSAPHPDGLFAEEIFGQIGSPDRMVTFGYIELNTALIAPIIYKNMLKLSALYEGIISGKVYAVFDKETKNFIRIEDDPELVEGANTGYSFFMEHFKDIEFAVSQSNIRENRIELISKYQDISIYRRFLVLPAGLRDFTVEETTGRLAQDEINKLYTALLSMSKSITPGSSSDIFDGVRYACQRKAVEIYDHLENIITGKYGFMQGHVARRNIVLGTRNVLTAPSYYMASPNDPQALGPDETKVGLYQTMKGSVPIVAHTIQSVFLSPILGTGDVAKVALTNPDTYELVYSHLPPKELNKFNTPDAIELLINKFKNTSMRELPITLTTTEGYTRYLCLVYDTVDSISLVRSKKDLLNRVPDADLKRLRPITWIELFYLATYVSMYNKHATITRDPVIEEGSVYPSKIHVMSTTTGRVVDIVDLLSGTMTLQCPQYPILGTGTYFDSVAISIGRYKGLGADNDGDTITTNFLFSDQANAENDKYLNDISAILTPEYKFLYGEPGDTVARMWYNFTGEVPAD